MPDFVLHRDCRHVRWDRPCTPHKLRGRECAGCPEYAPVRHKVLVVKLAATGDVLRTTSFLHAVHVTWPQAKVTWVTKPAAAGLFRGNAMVDEVLATDDMATVARLQTESFDAVLCPDADPDAVAIASMARAKERRGFRRDEQGGVVPLGEGARHWLEMGLSDARKRANTETYQTLVARVLGFDPALVREPVLEPSGADRKMAAEVIAATGFSGTLVGLNTGAGGRWEYKQWTYQHQLEFLRTATAAGLGVLLLGGPEEVGRHAQLLSATHGLAVFDGGNGNSYGQFAALVERCRVVVTSDSLAAHVAAARRVPAVVLFGPTSAPEIELYGRGVKLTPPGFDCLGCYLPRCDKVPHCQQAILPSSVLAAVQQLLR
ncbi:MAG: hypothetical protein RL148_663 [Planctomycetota bacterium]|jgi:heptosyltransferase-2